MNIPWKLDTPCWILDIESSINLDNAFTQSYSSLKELVQGINILKLFQRS
jgi:hypothetical protein